MSSVSRRRRSISKQRGDEMSSRLMPPKTGASAVTIRDDLVGIVRVEADRERVDAAELLEQHRLALHDGQRRRGADVAEAQHGAAVADDGDGVLLDRQRPDLARVVGDRLRDAGDAGRVRHRKVVARLERRLRDDLELAAEVQQERPVGDVLDHDAVERLSRLDDPARCAPHPLASTVTSRIFVPSSTRTRSIASSRPPCSATTAASAAKTPGVFCEMHAQRRAELRRRMRRRGAIERSPQTHRPSVVVDVDLGRGRRRQAGRASSARRRRTRRASLRRCTRAARGSGG